MARKWKAAGEPNEGKHARCRQGGVLMVFFWGGGALHSYLDVAAGDEDDADEEGGEYVDPEDGNQDFGF